LSPTFSALRVHNYRLYIIGALVSNTGTWMQRVAQDWLVLQLTHGSAAALGITTGLQFLPMLLVTPLAGVVVDRVSKRKLLLGTQAFLGLTALSLGILDATGVVTVGAVYVIALLLGVGAAVDTPTRQAFVVEMVGREDLANAVGLNSAAFNAARIVGPAFAGLLIVWSGTSVVFFINAASFLAVIIAQLMMNRSELRPSVRTERGPGQLREGLYYLRSRRDLVLVLVVVCAVGTFGFNFQMTTALMATQVFHKGAGEYGLLGSIMAIGSLSGALIAARRQRPTLPLVAGSAVVFGLLTVASGLMPTYVSFALLLIPVGLSALTVMTAANATVQLSVAPEFRGRVMAWYMAIFMGGTPVGAPLIGWIGEVLGARWTLIVGGALSGLAGLVVLVLARGVSSSMVLQEQLSGASGAQAPEAPDNSEHVAGAAGAAGAAAEADAGAETARAVLR
jgi:MFS family permease